MKEKETKATEQGVCQHNVFGTVCPICAVIQNPANTEVTEQGAGFFKKTFPSVYEELECYNMADDVGEVMDQYATQRVEQERERIMDALEKRVSERRESRSASMFSPAHIQARIDGNIESYEQAINLIQTKGESNKHEYK